MNEVKVSIIIPVYNGETYLKRCLESIINQTLKEIEIIVVNDGSTEKSKDIILTYCNADNRIKFINKKKEGVSVARNKGIEMATGQYLFFCDCDDYIEMDGIEEMYNIAIEKDTDIVIFNSFIGKSKLNVVKFPKEKKIVEKKVLVNANTDFFLPYLWRNLYKNTELQNKIRFNSNLKYGEDSLYNLKSYLAAKSIYASEKAFYHYMPNKNSTMSSKKNNFLLYLSNLYNEKMKVYEENDLNEFKQDLYNYTICHSLNILIDEVIKFTSVKKLKIPFKEIRESSMIEESYKYCNINIDKINISKFNRNIIKLLKKRQYNLISLYVTIRYLYLSRLKKELNN